MWMGLSTASLFKELERRLQPGKVTRRPGFAEAKKYREEGSNKGPCSNGQSS